MFAGRGGLSGGDPHADPVLEELSRREFRGRPVAVLTPELPSDYGTCRRRKRVKPALQILAPVDLSNKEDGGIDDALAFARAMDAELTLLHVADHVSIEPGGEADWPASVRASSQSDYDVHHLVRAGNVPETVAGYADFISADFVFMPSANFVKWPGFWHRSTAAEVMKRSRRSICLTNPRSDRTKTAFPLRRILCLLNLDGTDGTMVRQAQILAKKFDSELLLMGIIPEVSEGLLIDGIPEMNRPLSAEAAGERMEILSGRLGVPHTSTLAVGCPYQRVGQAARAYGADLVVASRSMRGSPNLCCLDMRSLLRALPCLLLSVPADAQRR